MMNLPVNFTFLLYKPAFSQFLAAAYPGYPWATHMRTKSAFYKKSQHMLKVVLKTLFPQEGSIFGVYLFIVRTVGRV
jgi:hypothetical protein